MGAVRTDRRVAHHSRMLALMLSFGPTGTGLDMAYSLSSPKPRIVPEEVLTVGSGCAAQLGWHAGGRQKEGVAERKLDASITR